MSNIKRIILTHVHSDHTRQQMKLRSVLLLLLQMMDDQRYTLIGLIQVNRKILPETAG
jgi:glyoxylase-like metal-dependent hydrolase (beta-lactamase superfamily II)